MLQSAVKQYDIRGIVGKHFTCHDVYAYTKAFLEYCQTYQRSTINTLIIGYDARQDSYDLAHAVAQAAIHTNVEVVWLGQTVTPHVVFALHQKYGDVGIMVTASHNPKQYNGLKLYCGTQSLHGKQLQTIYEIYEHNPEFKEAYPVTYQPQSADNIYEAYVDSLAKEAQGLVNMQYKILFDAGHGPSGKIIKELISRLGWAHADLFLDVADGNFPIHSPDPTSQEAQKYIESLLVQKQYDAAFAFDGDADRLVVYLPQGKILRGDELLFLFAFAQKDKNELQAVVDIKTSATLLRVLQSRDISCNVVPTGCAYIKAALKDSSCGIGGEVSGHYFFTDRHPGYDDGIYAAIRLLNLAVENDGFAHLFSYVPITYDSPEIRIPFEESLRDTLLHNVIAHVKTWESASIDLHDGIRYVHEKYWFIIRCSHTEPVISLRFGGNSRSLAAQCAEKLVNLLQVYIDKTVVERYVRYHERI